MDYLSALIAGDLGRWGYYREVSSLMVAMVLFGLVILVMWYFKKGRLQRTFPQVRESARTSS